MTKQPVIMTAADLMAVAVKEEVAAPASVNWPVNIWDAILRVRKRVPYVQKRAPVPGGGLPYSYLNIEDALAALRPAMNENLLVLVPRKAKVLSAADYSKGDGKATTKLVRVLLTYRLVFAPNGEHVKVQVIGEAADTSDKAVNKAFTAGLKVALRQTFLLEVGENDPDTRLAEELGADKAMFDKAVRALELQKSVAALDAKWESVGKFYFSGEQIESMRPLYEELRQHLPGGAAPGKGSQG